MTETRVQVQSEYIRVVLRYDYLHFPDSPTLPQMAEVFSSLGHLFDIVIDLDGGDARSLKVFARDDFQEIRTLKYSIEPQVVSVRFNSPMEIMIALGGAGTLGVGVVVAQRIANSLLDLMQKTLQLRRDAAVLDAQKTAADVLKAQLLEHARKNYNEDTTRGKKVSDSAKAKRDAEKAALALSILQTVEVKEE